MIYIDELLIKFRESGLGVLIGALIQSALSFADDLILASPDDSTSEKQRKFEYLCTSFDSTGDWSHYLETQMRKMRKVLGANYTFSREAPIRFV